MHISVPSVLEPAATIHSIILHYITLPCQLLGRHGCFTRGNLHWLVTEAKVCETQGRHSGLRSVSTVVVWQWLSDRDCTAQYVVCLRLLTVGASVLFVFFICFILYGAPAMSWHDSVTSISTLLLTYLLTYLLRAYKSRRGDTFRMPGGFFKCHKTRFLTQNVPKCFSSQGSSPTSLLTCGSRKVYTLVIIIIITSASVELTQTRHSHSKQLFHGGQISVFLQGGSKSFIRCL